MMLTELAQQILNDVQKHGDAAVAMIGIVVRGEDGHRYRLDGDAQLAEIVRDPTIVGGGAYLVTDYTGEKVVI